jgi:pimeloyl-ACP methyl ester carboxylesterase
MAKLNYNEYGEGKPLIIMHGLFGSARNWNSIAKALAGDRRVFAVDLRNHGDSPDTGSMTYPEMVADLQELLDGLGLPAAALLGHSMGGKVAMAFALSHPERTEALMVADIAPVVYSGNFMKFIDAMLALPLEKIRSRSEADEHLREAGIEAAMVRQFLLQSLVRGKHGYAWQLNLKTLRKSLTELSGFPADWPRPYTGPVCFLSGTDSDYLLPEHRDVIRALFPAATLRSIEGAGHWLHAEKPEAFVREVRDFLKEAPDAGEK